MILPRLRDYILQSTLYDKPGKPASPLAIYPSVEWNVKPWSFRLVEDLLLKQSLHRSRLGDDGGWRLRLADYFTRSAWSFHRDAEHKALLFTALRLREEFRDRIVVLPEVGPYGLDMLMARAAGFTRFVAYDRDQATIDSCRDFHAGVDANYTVSSSGDFDFSPFKSTDYLIIFPDWPHDSLDKRLRGFDNVLRYSYRVRRDNMMGTKSFRKLGIQRLMWRELFAALDKLD